MEESRDEIDGWRIERAIAEGDVLAFAVVRGEQRARLDIVAPGKSSTLLHAATTDRTLVVRGKHEGRAYVVTTDAAQRVKRRSALVPVLALALLAIGGAVAFVMTRDKATKRACDDCVLIVNGEAVPTSAFKIYAADPYLFPDRHGTDRQRAAMDLLIAKTVLSAEVGRTKPPSGEPASETEYAIGLRTFDIREKLTADGDPYDDKTIDRYARTVGLSTRQDLLDYMRTERMAIAMRGDRTNAELCAAAKVTVVMKLDGYVPCATFK